MREWSAERETIACWFWKQEFIDVDNSGLITFDEFLNWASWRHCSPNSLAICSLRWQDMFQCLDWEELRKVCSIINNYKTSTHSRCHVRSTLIESCRCWRRRTEPKDWDPLLNAGQMEISELSSNNFPAHLSHIEPPWSTYLWYVPSPTDSM